METRSYQEKLEMANQIIEDLQGRGLSIEISRKLEEAGFERIPRKFTIVYEGENIKASYSLLDLLSIKQKGRKKIISDREATDFLSNLINNYLEDI